MMSTETLNENGEVIAQTHEFAPEPYAWERAGDAFFGRLRVEYLDGRRWIVRNSPSRLFGFLLADGRRIVPADGYRTDFASVPRILQGLLPAVGDGSGASYGPAAVIHDWLYAVKEVEGEPIRRKEADSIFLRGMRALGVSRIRRTAMYLAVRAGGYFAWRD